MKNNLKNFLTSSHSISASILLLLIAGSAYASFNSFSLISTIDELSTKLISSTDEVIVLQNTLSKLLKEKEDLGNQLLIESERNNQLAEEVGDIVGTVNTLEKLSKTDKELLQKYSKVYFLNEHYTPENLVEINKDYLQYPESKQEIRKEVYSYVKKLIRDAKEENLIIQVNSAYRSFRTQAALKANYRVVYGTGSNAFSADQGYSEHQLGTTLDFGTPSIRGNFDLFEGTPEYKWLTDNAYKYGFVLSYPKGNKYYVFEPWHWRFVGLELAEKLHEDNKFFYDMEQREIDTYLVNIFD